MIQLTTEQNDIVYSENKHVFVSARAGTGKTTTLSEYVKLRKKDKFLYIVYNNSIKEEAMSKFIQNTTIHTIHSLAYQELGFEYADKLKNNLKEEDIMQLLPYFKDKDKEDSETHKIALSIKKLLNAYFNSEQRSIKDITDNTFIGKLAEEYWKGMKDIDNKNFKITHDGYLKLYQLSNPKLNFDYIMVDEAQDSNEVMLDIVCKQDCHKLFVGDPHQKIYGFRGAINIFHTEKYLKQEEDTEFYTLTESFRFGPEIADVANRILSNFKGETALISGVSNRDSVVGAVDKELQYTIITRTNANLIDIAIEAARNNKKIFIVGGEQSIINHIMDGYYLFKGEKEFIKNDYLKTLKNYSHLKILAETLKNPEQMLLVYLLEKYGEALQEYIEIVKRHISGKKQADIILTTAHKSKGLEFCSVVIASDFGNLFNDNGEKLNSLEPEEINLLYVAVTRATHDLELNKDLKNLF